MVDFIKNSQNENICIQIFEPTTKSNQPKLAIICHGITGYKEQEVILQTVETLSNLGYVVVTFDCRNSRGESFNNDQCATLTSMEEDLQAIINWAVQQDFYTQPFLLAGHSLGGSVVLNYAEEYPQIVSHLVLISTIFDGNELIQNTAKYSPDFLQQLQNGGVVRSRNNIDCFLDDTYLKDLLQYNLYNNLEKISFPTLLITGDKDTTSLPENNQRFYASLRCRKELYVLSNCSHVYDTVQNKKDLDDKIREFLIN